MKLSEVIKSNLVNSKMAGGRVNLTPPLPSCGFSKNISSKERMKPWFFVAVNIIISHIFPENFMEVPEVVQKI